MLVGLAVAAAVVAGAVVAARSGGPGGGASATDATEPAPVEVTSDAPRFATLAALVEAADAVVVGEVVAVEPGRWFGDDSTGRLRSRLVTLAVDEVVAGSGPDDDAVLVEEEGWTADGAPLVVDGAAPSAVGDRGVWFLVDGGDPTTGAWITVGAQGRYLLARPGTGDAASPGTSGAASPGTADAGDRALVGAAGDDPLVAELAGETLETLVARIRAAA
ncbi:MAG: hypothetical protein KDA98_11880 [Acidimicrobiales bacterium]|nr:hypothetical protein [Acidimicrobiales bacterium]